MLDNQTIKICLHKTQINYNFFILSGSEYGQADM